MTLNDILKEQTLQNMSQVTKISEENLDQIVNEEFSSLVRAKALGFISILEREYKVDLKVLKEKALVYYEEQGEEASVNIALPRVEEPKERSKLFLLFIFGLLAYASWYFFTQFDKKTLGNMLPFTEEKTIAEPDDANTTIKEKTNLEKLLNVTNIFKQKENK